MVRQEGYKITFAMQGSKDPVFSVPTEHQAFSLLYLTSMQLLGLTTNSRMMNGVQVNKHVPATHTLFLHTNHHVLSSPRIMKLRITEFSDALP